MLLPLSQVTAVISRVMFPALSRIQHDKPRVKSIYLRTVALIGFVTFPMMTGLLAVCGDFVLAVLGEKWGGLTSVLRILCVLGLFQSVGSSAGWIYQSQGRTGLQLAWGLGSSAVTLSSVCLGVWLGTIETVALCLLASGLAILWYPAFAIPGRLIGMRFREVIEAVGGSFLCAATMGLLVWTVGELMIPSTLSPALRLGILVPFGGVSYVMLAGSSKLRAFATVMRLLKHLPRSSHAGVPDDSASG
jgi:PST family polysaccharide transporter